MQVGAAVAVVLLSLVVSPAHAAPADVDAQQLFLFAELLERAKHLPAERESAAFLVRDSDNGLYLIRWPESTSARQSTYRGRIPAGTIAIAHTHPELTHLRMPSAHDAALARHTGLDIYVITHAEIWVARGATGNVVRIVSNGSWSARAHSRRLLIASSPGRSRTRDILRSRAADE